MYQAHLPCVFKVIHGVAKVTLIRLMGIAIGRHGQGHDDCNHSLLQVRLCRSFKTEGSGYGTQSPILRQRLQEFMARYSRVLWSSSVGGQHGTIEIRWLRVNLASSDRSSPEWSSGNYSKHGKMIMMLKLACTENSKYITHYCKCLTGINT